MTCCEGLRLGEVRTKEVACEMLKKGMSIDLIAEVTHLDSEEVERLRETL
ncbi:hypothetical protein ABRT01_08570 [Lentibacillus sp. L22]